MNKYFAEFIGTLLLVLLACGSAVLAGPAIGVLGIGLCFGLILLCLCYCIGNISGCHVNPAVSFAMLLAGRMSGRDFCGYVVAQLPSALWPVPVFLHGLWPSRPAIISEASPPAWPISLPMWYNPVLPKAWLFLPKYCSLPHSYS